MSKLVSQGGGTAGPLKLFQDPEGSRDLYLRELGDRKTSLGSSGFSQLLENIDDATSQTEVNFREGDAPPGFDGRYYSLKIQDQFTGRMRFTHTHSLGRIPQGIMVVDNHEKITTTSNNAKVTAGIINVIKNKGVWNEQQVTLEYENAVMTGAGTRGPFIVTFLLF